MAEEWQVLIIGAGPAGATLALHLGKLGIKSLVISRYKGTANTPRAHIFNQRAMEVLRDAGLEARLTEVASSASDMQHTSWSNSLSGEEYGRMWSWGNKPAEKHRYEMASPCRMSDLPQSYLEPVLVGEAIKLGAVFRFGQEFINLRNECEVVQATIRRRDDSKEYTVKCKYLVGADGARSTVLDALGIPIIGRTINSAFNVHIKADLSQYLCNRPGSLNWILNTEAPDWSAVGNFRMVRPWREWVVSMHPAKKDNGQEFNPTEDQIKKRLYQMIGDDSVAIDILSTFRWNINDQVAESWQKGRVLCIGDAVHRHPPINGLGSNTCISDAFNLAWKLAFVLRGYANPVLLQSLTIERKPVGDCVVRRANEGMEAHRSLWALLGLTAEDRTKAMSVLGKADSQGKLARKRLRDAFDKTDAELQALGIQMNQIYVRSPATAIERNDKATSVEIDLLKEVAISTFPGYHLPHVWLAASGQSPRVSTLDLCGRGRFVVLTGLGGECWVQAAKEVSSSSGLEIGAYKIGFHCDFMDCYGDWGRVRDVDEEGVVLVRPDHFVGWRFFTASTEATVLLQAALNQILGK